MRVVSFAVILVAGLVLCACAPPAGAETTLVVETAAGATHNFTVELARSDEEIRRGLMFRESLDEDAGMLFFYPQCRIAAFWMKNTLIPLDMIFIEADGRIATIAAMTEPLSLDIHASGVPVNGVLEIGGGGAAARGIAPGDYVRHPWFGEGGAAVCG